MHSRVSSPPPAGAGRPRLSNQSLLSFSHILFAHAQPPPPARAHTREVRAPCGYWDIEQRVRERFSINVSINFTAFITKNYTRPHMTQACTPYKAPATRHHTQSTHQSAEAHTTSIIRDQLLSLVSGLSLTQSTGPRSLSTSTAATPSLRLGAVDPSGSRARPRAWRGDNQRSRARRRALAGGRLLEPSRVRSR